MVRTDESGRRAASADGGFRNTRPGSTAAALPARPQARRRRGGGRRAGRAVQGVSRLRPAQGQGRRPGLANRDPRQLLPRPRTGARAPPGGGRARRGRGVLLFRKLADEDPFPYSDSLHLDFLQQFGAEDVRDVLASLPERYRVPLVLVTRGLPREGGRVFFSISRSGRCSRASIGAASCSSGVCGTTLKRRTPKGGSTTMITCAEAVRQLWDYLDGVVDESQRESIEEHLAFCRRCCGEVEFAEELRRVLAEHPETEPARRRARAARRRARRPGEAAVTRDRCTRKRRKTRAHGLRSRRRLLRGGRPQDLLRRGAGAGAAQRRGRRARRRQPPPPRRDRAGRDRARPRLRRRHRLDSRRAADRAGRTRSRARLPARDARANGGEPPPSPNSRTSSRSKAISKRSFCRTRASTT